MTDDEIIQSKREHPNWETERLVNVTNNTESLSAFRHGLNAERSRQRSFPQDNPLYRQLLGEFIGFIDGVIINDLPEPIKEALRLKSLELKSRK
ncbi:MAG: hypothetical protein ACTHJ8_12960 [Mucilaginibacter sp.]